MVCEAETIATIAAAAEIEEMTEIDAVEMMIKDLIIITETALHRRRRLLLVECLSRSRS